MAGSGRAPANPPVPRPVAGTMLPIHVMRQVVPAFDEMVEEAGGYYHTFGTGNRKWRRKVAALARTWRGTRADFERFLDTEFALYMGAGE